MSKQLVLVTVTGPDHPGITAELMNCICQSEAVIEDMGQSITHGLLSLSILIDVSDHSSLIKDLLFSSKKLGVELEFEVIEDKKRISKKGDKYILSCVSLDGITAQFLRDTSTLLAKYNINIQRIDNVTEEEFKSLEIATKAHKDDVPWDTVKEELINLSNLHKTDLALLKDDVWRRNKRLIVFDMDSTLIQSEVIVEIAKKHGVGEKVHEITERAMEGELNFDESLLERVRLLEGFKVNQLDEIAQNIKLTEGVEEFVSVVKSLGYKLAIISGGFTYFADHFKQKLGLDYAFANELDIKDGMLTGHINGTIVNADQKAILVDLLAQQEGIKREQVVAIGDGANDLKMLAKAGLGIAFHAKDIVKQNAKQHMSHGPMTSILYFLGIPGAKANHD